MTQPSINTPNNKAPEFKDSQKLKSSKVKDVISKSRTMTGSKPDNININPIQEAAEKTAVMAYGRFNPPTTGHEKLIHKVESVADEHGGTAHIIASHSQGNSKNPLPTDKKLGYIKKVAREGTHVSSSDKENPSFLQQAKKLHDAGNKHLVMVAGSDRAEDYHKKLHQYNGTHEGALYNFKTIKVVSAGHRDPDAEGTEGMSGTKMRAHAHAGNEKAFKSGLPKALHPHAKEIMNHIRSVKEEEEIFDTFVEEIINECDESEYLEEKLSVQQRLRKALSMRRWGTKLELARKRSLMRRATSKVVMKRAKRLAIKKLNKVCWWA
jgi:phosphopantetheine adenylyltransferase